MISTRYVRARFGTRRSDAACMRPTVGRHAVERVCANGPFKADLKVRLYDRFLLR